MTTTSHSANKKKKQHRSDGGDFKKVVKGRVRKKALKPANVTDTKIRATSLRLPVSVRPAAEQHEEIEQLKQQDNKVDQKANDEQTLMGDSNSHANDSNNRNDRSKQNKKKSPLSTYTGRSIVQLIQTLQYHSTSQNSATGGVVRLSAIRELRELVTKMVHHSVSIKQQQQLETTTGAATTAATKATTNTSTQQQQQPIQFQMYLAELIPILGKCCIDEQKEIRMAGLHIVRDMITMIIMTTSATTTTPTRTVPTTTQSIQGMRLLRPYAPLLMAYVSLALHSLNKSIRWHGVLILESLLRWKQQHHHPSIDSSTSTITETRTLLLRIIPFEFIQEQIWKLLVPLTRLLVDDINQFVLSSSSSSGITTTTPSSSSTKNSSVSARDGHGHHHHTNKNSSSSSRYTEQQQIVLNVIIALFQTRPWTESGTTINFYINSCNVYPPIHHPLQQQQQPLADLIIRDPGGITCPQGLIMERFSAAHQTHNRQRPRSRPLFSSMLAMPSFEDLESVSTSKVMNIPAHAVASQQHQQQPSSSTSSRVESKSDDPLSVSIQFLSKIRDLCIEMMEKHFNFNPEMGIGIPECDLQILGTAIQSIRLFWLGYGSTLLIPYPTSSSSTTSLQPIYKLNQQLMSLVMDWFPIREEEPSVKCKRMINTEASSMILLLSTLFHKVDILAGSGSTTTTTKPSLASVETIKVSQYIHTQLQHCHESNRVGTRRKQKQHLSKSLLESLWQILIHPISPTLSASGRSSSSKPNEMKQSLIKECCECVELPCDEGEDGASHESNLASSWILSDTTKQLIFLIEALLEHCRYSIPIIQVEYGQDLIQTIRRLPRCLKLFQGNYLQESTGIIRMMHTILRNDNLAQDDRVLGTDWLSDYRIAIDDIMVSESFRHSSIFEVYPEQLEYLCIYLLGMLESPTIVTVKSLGRICARSRLGMDNSIATSVCFFIVQMIDEWKKTIPLNVFLGFLIECTGILHIEEAFSSTITQTKEIPMDEMELYPIISRILLLDKGIAESSCCMMRCDIIKVITMLEPFFSQFLLHVPDEPQCSWMNMQWADYITLVQCRASVSMLVMLSMDLQKQSSLDILSIVPPVLIEKSFKAVCHVLLFCLSSISPTSSDHMGLWREWKNPMISWLGCQERFILRVFEYLILHLDSQNTSNTQQEQSTILHLLLQIVMDPLLDHTVQQSLHQLIGLVQTIPSRIGQEGIENDLTQRLLDHLDWLQTSR